MNAVILSIGTELTTGQVVDSNAVWLAERLTEMSVHVLEHRTVPDAFELIRTAIQEAMGRAVLVIVTGGLGPTPDDLTRHALAEAIGQPLEENPEALGQIEHLFARLSRTMSSSNRVQALIPAGCTVLANARGTAPGIWHHTEVLDVLALPGVPAEMMAMFESSVIPLLRTRLGAQSTRVGCLYCVGVSEARIGELLADRMAPGRNPLVGTSATHGVIKVRIVASGRDGAEAEAWLSNEIVAIRDLLGPFAFGGTGDGEDTLEAVVGGLLARRGATLATAESCTGGLLGKRLTDVPGSSAYFLRGYITYSDLSKCELLGVPEEVIAVDGAVSEPVARAMAQGCRRASRADIALSITGIAGPSGGAPPEKPVGLVYVGMADADGVEVRRLLLGDHLERDEIRERACSAALNMLRMRLGASDQAAR